MSSLSFASSSTLTKYSATACNDFQWDLRRCQILVNDNKFQSSAFDVCLKITDGTYFTGCLEVIKNKIFDSQKVSECGEHGLATLTTKCFRNADEN